MRSQRIAAVALSLALLVSPMAAAADEVLTIEVSVNASCGDGVDFIVSVEGGIPPYTVSLDFGDEESYAAQVGESSWAVSHAYPAHGTYAWSLLIEDAAFATGEASGSIDLLGPSLSLESEPSPPLLTLMDDEASASFTASAEGGLEPYVFEWDLDGDGVADEGLAGNEVSNTYNEAGEYAVNARVTDACGFSDSVSLLVIVLDPEEDPETACHPMALRIAEALSAIFPTQAERTYSCEDILAIFNGEVFGFQVGFGRMWHAYQLTQVIEDLTWEQLRDWHLENGGWGILLQLNRFADLLETYSILDLMEMVASDEYTLGDIRAAVRAVTRYEADFDDALSRLDAGASPGELGQFYRLAQELGEDTAALDAYLADGFTLSEMRHAAGLAERLGSEWGVIMEARSFEHSWGAIGQAYRLADEEHSAADILAIGVQEYRAQMREQERATREQERSARRTEADNRTGARLAEQYGVALEEVMGLFQGDCSQSWGCVRETLRNQAQSGSGRVEQRAAQIATQFGKTVEEVLAVYNGSCGQEWSCVRAYFRSLVPRGGGQDNN